MQGNAVARWGTRNRGSIEQREIAFATEYVIQEDIAKQQQRRTSVEVRRRSIIGSIIASIQYSMKQRDGIVSMVEENSLSIG